MKGLRIFQIPLHGYVMERQAEIFTSKGPHSKGNFFFQGVDFLVDGNLDLFLFRRQEMVHSANIFAFFYDNAGLRLIGSKPGFSGRKSVGSRFQIPQGIDPVEITGGGAGTGPSSDDRNACKRGFVALQKKPPR